MKSHKLIKNPKISGKCILVLLILIFCLTMTTFIVNDSDTGEKEFIRVSNSSVEAFPPSSTNFFSHKNVETNKINSIDRVTRYAENKTNGQSKSQKSYYEEQQPVVVHAESALPLMDLNDSEYAEPNQINGHQREEKNERVGNADYANDDDDDDDVYYDNERFNDYDESDNRAQYEEYSEGRSNQMSNQYDARQQSYFPWSYRNSAAKEVTSQAAATKSQTPQPYSGYTHEIMEYDYPMGFVRRPQSANDELKMPYNPDVQRQNVLSRTPNRQQTNEKPLPLPLQPPSSPSSSSSSSSLNQRPTGNVSNVSTLLSVAKGLKMMWDIYQAFSAAWNAIAEHRQRQEEKLKQEQQERIRTRERINSKKPPKFDSNNRNATVADDLKNNDLSNKSTTNATNSNNTKIKSTKSPKAKSTTSIIAKTTRTTAATTAARTTTTIAPKSTTAKVEPRRRHTKGDRTLKLNVYGMRDGERKKRNDNEAVAEGRYIKGDPLKGYYDFVITEGSYKFWAVFQTGTALLIIYSVFAAIYYSKVNPLVSDYDYTDYLGGARSLSNGGGGDLDFVDDEDDDHSEKSSTNWYKELVPKAGHSIKFILDAIDKIPADHQDSNYEDYETTTTTTTTDG